MSYLLPALIATTFKVPHEEKGYGILVGYKILKITTTLEDHMAILSSDGAGEGVEVPATGSEDSGTMPDGSNSPPAERVKRRRTQLTPPASPAATKGRPG